MDEMADSAQLSDEKQHQDFFYKNLFTVFAILPQIRMSRKLFRCHWAQIFRSFGHFLNYFWMFGTEMTSSTRKNWPGMPSTAN